MRRDSVTVPHAASPPRVDFPLSPVLYELAAACTAREDLIALVLFHTADILRHEARYAVHRDARNRFFCNTIATLRGPISRLFALTDSAHAVHPDITLHPYSNESLIPLTDLFTNYFEHQNSCRAGQGKVDPKSGLRHGAGVT